MDLVTITCLRDYHQMMLQSASIQRFVDPCTHWVILCEQDDSIIKKQSYRDFWKYSLEPYYDKHKLNLLFPIYDIEQPSYGWERQQYYKLLISEYIENIYLVLDSKNFFIKKCSTNDWNNVLGCGLVRKITKSYPGYQTLELYAKHFGIDIGTVLLEAVTPFVIDKTLLKNLYPLKTTFSNLLKTKISYISEFQIYSYGQALQNQLAMLDLIDNHIVRHRDMRNRLLRPEYYQPFSEQLIDYDHNDPELCARDRTLENVKCFGIHRLWCDQAPYSDIVSVRQWINSLGINQTFLPYRSY